MRKLAIGSIFMGAMFASAPSVHADCNVTTPSSGISYEYDALGRLICARYAGEEEIAYSYDAAGNRTSVAILSNNSGDTDPPVPDQPPSAGEVKTIPVIIPWAGSYITIPANKQD